MAYLARRRSTRAPARRRSTGYSGRRRVTRSRNVRRSSPSRVQTVRLVIEQPGQNMVARPASVAMKETATKKAKF